MEKMMKRFVWIIGALLSLTICAQAQQATTTKGKGVAKTAAKSSGNDLLLVHPAMGDTASSADGSICLKLVGQKQNFAGGQSATRDADINSPKSINIHPDGKKYYVNSLEGCTTVCYDFTTNTKLKVIRHSFREGRDDALWAPESGLYPWRHYKDNLNTFSGKPVESTFSHGGRYLWVPYYRRTFDINAQDPSAVAVIDTKTDAIVRLMETGPLPKMITTSPDGRTVAISHWGNNTVGLIDISSPTPSDWHHTQVLTVDYELKLDFPLDRSVDRDNGSGYALRGTVFTPDGRYLLVGCMGGGGGIAVIDIPNKKYLGRVMGMMANVRHLVIANGYLYLSINKAGYVQRIRLQKFMDAAKRMTGRTTTVIGWENAKVGGGARTICISPDGRYVFAACNMESQLYVVDTQTMKAVCKIAVDSYPVGMDLSSDGRYVFTTSQGRGNKGGNSVCIFEVKYKTAPTTRHCANCGEKRTSGEQKCHKCGVSFAGTYAMIDSLNTDEDVPMVAENENSSASSWLLLGGGILVLLAAGAFFKLRGKK